jgi:polyhydroxyalkanoate synthase subunit PhaC
LASLALAAPRTNPDDERAGQSVQGEAASLGATPDAFGRASFAAMDILRRALGNALGAFGLDPDECPYRIVSLGPHWRLRDYGGDDTSLSLLIVAAPIKRAYIWDLAPSVSAVRYCMREGLHVHLLEWMPASQRNQNNGLDEYTEAISECVAKISGRAPGTTPFLVGHSLGGTLAAIFSTLAPESIRGLILLGAPLCFEPATSRFRDALVSLTPPALSDGDPFPGSLLSFIATLASPGTFVWSRLIDTALSITDRQALEINARVERWALDEVPLPGRLVHQIIQWLYRENRFCRGTLRIRQMFVGPSNLTAPALAVVTMADEVAPLASVKPCIDAMPATDVRIIRYPGEVGVGLQHLGILVGRQARAHVWPEIISWIKTHS